MSARSCRDIRADLSAYLDGDLDADLTGATRAHLETCAACRSELELLRLTVAALRRQPVLPPPAAILAGVRARLRPEPWYRRFLGGGFRTFEFPLGAAATVLVIAGISLLWLRNPEMSETLSRDPFPRPPAAPAAQLPTPSKTIVPPVPVDHRPKEDRQSAPPAPVARRREARRLAVPPPAPVAAYDLREYDAPGAPAPTSAIGGLKVATAGSPADAGSGTTGRDGAASSAPSAPSALSDRSTLMVRLKRRQSEPHPFPVEAPKDTLREETSRTENRVAATSFALLGDEKKSSAESAPQRIRFFCLLPRDGDSVEDLARWLRREGADSVAVRELEPWATREAFDPHRRRFADQPEPSRGWTVTAAVPPNVLVLLLDARAGRTCLRLPGQPTPDPGNPEVPVDLQITVVR